MSAETATPSLTAATGLPTTLPTQAKLPDLARNIGLVGLAIAFIGLLFDPDRNGRAWLIGYGFWFAIAVGTLFCVQITYIFDAGWSTIIRRQWEHVLAAFPWLFVLILPVAVIIPFLNWLGLTGVTWIWMDTDAMLPGPHAQTVDSDILYQKKSPFLNVPFFTVRLLMYFAVFSALAVLLRFFSVENDVYPTPQNYSACRKISGLGIFLTAGAMTFAAFDWFMSLSFHWFSTMYGVWFFATSMRAALAFTVILCFFLSTRGPLKGLMTESHYYLLGCMKLAFTVFWAYISFSQYFLIYHANIPEETFWYNLRQLDVNGEHSTWWNVGLFLVFGNFLVPFLLLLWYKIKVTPKWLMFLSVYILAVTIIDLYYNILPSKVADATTAAGYFIRQLTLGSGLLFDFAALVGVGGIFVWAILRSMKRHAPIPVRDPNILESLNCTH